MCKHVYTYISLFESGRERTTRFHGNSPLLSNFSPSLSVLRSPISIFPSLLSLALRFILVYILLVSSLTTTPHIANSKLRAPSFSLPLPSLSALTLSSFPPRKKTIHCQYSRPDILRPWNQLSLFLCFFLFTATNSLTKGILPLAFFFWPLVLLFLTTLP